MQEHAFRCISEKESLGQYSFRSDTLDVMAEYLRASQGARSQAAKRTYVQKGNQQYCSAPMNYTG